MLIQSDLGYMSTWLFGLVVEMGMLSGISSANFAQSSFYISDYAESETNKKKKKNSPRKLTFQHFDLIMISVSNFISNFRN